MEPHLTDDELLQIENDFNNSTKGEWIFALIREMVKKEMKLANGTTKEYYVDPRWDIYVKTESGSRQILHMHPESPVVHEKHWNLNDGKFVTTAHALVPKMIAEIKRLRGKNGE